MKCKEICDNQIPIIMPAYEPDGRMNELILQLRQIYKGPIIVINDGSGTEYNLFYEQAIQQGCTVLEHYANMGKGRALKNAFNYCLNNFKDMLGCITIDSDGQHTPDDIIHCMSIFKENPNTLVLGCRDFDSENVPVKSKFGNKLTKKVCKLLCGISISDTQTGLRVIPKSFMEQLLNVAGERFEFETRMLIESKDVYPIIEVEIETVYDSKENHQTHFNPIKDSWRIYRIFFGEFFKFLLSSLSSCVIDLLLFYMFCKLLSNNHLWYVSGATVLARLVSATYNYIINYWAVFESKQQHKKSTVRYILLALVQMACSAAFVTLGIALFSFIPNVVIKIIVDTVLFFISFSIQREVVFND